MFFCAIATIHSSFKALASHLQFYEKELANLHAKKGVKMGPRN